MASEQPDLLFFDTFSHDTSEDLNLDLVQFPKSVFVREIRIIPLGARVEGDFPGGVRLGATNPTKFHIDFFVNDLSKPGASTFESLGSLEYCQNGQIHMECSNDAEQPRIPTDGLVLRGFYTTITLAVYGTLTQVVPETPAAVVNQPPPIQRPVSREANSLPANVPQNTEWNQEASNPIPALPYTANVATSNPDAYGPNQYPENYDNQVYRNEYYPNDPPPKDPRTYHHIEDGDWDKDRQDIPSERDVDRLRRSPRSLEVERDRERREGRSRRRSIDRARSRETSRHRDRSRELDRLDRLRSRSRSRDRDYVVKGEYRPLSRSRSHSIDRDRDWDRGSYKKDDYRRHRDSSYDRSRGGSYEPRSPYDKRAPSYERKIGYDKAAYEKRSPYDKRSSSFERRAPSPYDRKRHSPYRVRASSYGSRSPSRDDPRKRPRTPPGESRRPLSPRDGDTASPINSVRSEDPPEFDRNGKLIPRIDYYHPNYRHKSSIRSPSQEIDTAFAEQPHSSLVTVPIVDTTKTVETLVRNPEDESMDAEPFEPILSDEDICDDLDERSYMDVDYDVKEYCGVDDIIKYYNPFKDEWRKYSYVNKLYLLSDDKCEKDVMSATFNELSDASNDLNKISDLCRTAKKREQKFFCNTFLDIDNSSREDWVHLCEQLYVSLSNLCKNTDIILRIFRKNEKENACDDFVDVCDLLVTFCRIGLNFELALAQQQPTYKIRHMKCGIRLIEALMAHQHSGHVMKYLLDNGINIPMQLLEMYSKEYMALSLRLMILKSLNACLSSKVAIECFMENSMFPKFDKNDNSRRPINGYQALIAMMQCNPLGRIKFSLSALIKKLNIYEALEKLHTLVINFNKTTSKISESDEIELPEKDINFIVDSLEEILYTYRSQCFHLSQPKRFLPASAQFEISKECSNEILLEFFNIHNMLETFVFLLSCPSTCNNLVVTSPIHDLIFELVNTHNGLQFLYKKMEVSEILFKILIHPYGQQNSDETAYPHDSNLSNYSDLQILGLELAYRLKTMYYLKSICDVQAGKPDDNELIDRLQALYCLSFGSVGKTAVPSIIVMGDNAECLMEVFENDLKAKNKNESPSKQKSPAKGYAIELIVSAVRFAANVPFLKKYGQRLINVSKEHDRFEPSVSSVLQEVIPYLKPVEKSNVLAGEDLAECIEILKTSLEHSADLPGELMTCLRILRHYCISDYEKNSSIVCESPTEEYVELKYKYNVLQLFSLDGVAHISGILDRLAIHFDQPSMHTSFFASVRGLQLAQMLVPSLRLLDEMLVRVVRCRGPRFRDLTAAPILLKTYGIAKSFPVGSIGYRTAERASEAAVRALLAYAQPIADDAKDGDSIRRGLWTSLCSEVISYTMTAPYTFVPGLLVFSELLPLPLPLQTKLEPTPRELAIAANERRLWSAHLHALANDLVDMIQVICMSTYRPVGHMLRRVCVQVADLAPNTASVVARAAIGAVVRELGADLRKNAADVTADVRKPGADVREAAAVVREAEGGSEAGLARALGLLACLLSHAPVKCAVLHAMANGGPKANDLQTALCFVLSKPHGSTEYAAAQECAAHALAALCDGEVTLSPHSEPDAVAGNSLPSRDALATLLDATADCLSNDRTAGVASSILRAYFVLTEHEYGFGQFRKFLTRRRSALGKFFKWALEAGEERAECLALYLDLVRILRAEEGEAPGNRRSVLTPTEMGDMVEYSPTDEEHPAMSLEKLLKERNADEEVVSNAAFLITQLQKLPESEEATPEPAPPPPPQPLATQWAARTLRCEQAPHERLTAGYWLTVPPSPPADDDAALDLVSCDILELAQSLLTGGAGGGADSLAAGVRRLAGVPDARTETLAADDKRPAVALTRARDSDAFRSRPPNTSRPPSLHVDDFTALQHAPRARHYTPQHAPQHQLARGSRRFGGATPVPAHYRNLRGRGAWEMGSQHFGHFPPSQQYVMGGVGWGGGRMARGPRHRSFMR